VNPRDARWRRLRTAGPWVLDGLLALAAAGAGVAALASILPPGVEPPRAAAAYALVLAHTLPIAVRRRFPLPALAWALATGVAFAALGLNLVPLGFAILLYVYTVAARCSRPTSLASTAATLAMLLLVWLARPRSIGDGGTLTLDCLIVVAAWWLGDGVRRRQEAVVSAQERAAELERAREELARRAVLDERLRIARELHDIVAHGMSIVAVQAGVGAHVLDSRPERPARPSRPSRSQAARPWSRCAGSWACSARRPRPAAAWLRHPAWPSWTGWPPRWPRPACGSRS
jgi:signal transduction histidine kinase